jgi:uncharacterized pyridoxal phosphate-containing UPF0001 family protein
VAQALAAGVAAAERDVLEVLIQINIDDAPGRGGVPPGRAASLADAVLATAGLRLAGVMAVAPPRADPARSFQTLATVAAIIRAASPQANVISAGMSTDLEVAVKHGATHVRVGTALLGRRTPLLG